MAKPRIFISSTFYDLRQVRADLDFFIDQMGYEPVRNEEGEIPYGKEEALEEYCYREIKNVDILVCIIGGRFGSESKRGGYSITEMELKTAINEGKQVYIFIDLNVLSEYETYLLNKEKDIVYKYVDNVKIYKFIEEIKGYSSNNIIKGFETATDVVRYLKEQLAGLFQRLLEEQTRYKEISLIRGLEQTAHTLNQLVNYLQNENKDNSDEINRILMVNHPLVERLKVYLEISYLFYFESIKDVKKLFEARRYNFINKTISSEIYYEWNLTFNKKSTTIKIAISLFDDDGRLKFIKKSDWKDDYVVREVYDISNEEPPINDDLPF